MEGRNVCEVGGGGGGSPKQGLISTKDLTIELPEGHESNYHILNYPT